MEVITPAVSVVDRVWVNGTNKTQVTFNVEGKPERIVIDPNEWIVNWNREYALNGVEIRID